ncbi:RNA-binding protein [Mycobacterium sp. HUMS_1102779]|uniref:aminopeptidase n=1 Tax=Mycobacterium sp. HUMS_1102779 TaxID=3383487 RepID=UPI00389B1747
MTVRRLIVAVGAVLLLAGVIGLLVPVSISDGNGNSIGCGNAVAENTQSARNATQTTNNQTGANIPVVGQFAPHSPDYVAQCSSAVGSRRAWTIPLTVVGVLAVAGAFLVRRSEGAAPSV